MTTLALLCPTHGFVRGDHCPHCRTKEEVNAPSVHIFKPMVYTDICEEPLLIESKAQLKRECSKRGLVAARLL